jgi:hypothetical protein
MIRKAYTILCAVLFTANLFLHQQASAQTPQKMSYQAVVRDANNNLIVNQAIGVQISILKNSPYGAEVYKEKFGTNPTTNANGLLTLQIGTGTVLTGVFADITWSSGAYFIKAEIDPAGGTNYTITSTTQLLSVPYALYAKTAGNGFSGNYNDLTNKPKGNALGDMQYWNGTAWVMIPSGLPGQYMQLSSSGTPQWTGNYFPVLTTANISTKTRFTAICGGNITDNGGDTILARGICWSTSPNPTTANSKTVNGYGMGEYTSSMTGLTSGTTYYVRAYASNKNGTGYGPEISFATFSGNSSYTLYKEANPTAEQLNAYSLITAAMDSAVWYYNSYTTFAKVLSVYYNPGVPTAESNNTGYIAFGKTQYMQKVTAMHEVSHTVGVGTSGNWRSLMSGGFYIGVNATNMLLSLPNRSIDGNTGLPFVKIYDGGIHFWPYGLNYYSEYSSTNDLIYHCKLVNAMKLDGM